VVEYLEDLDPALAVRYLEFLIAEREEESQAFHDRMVELYTHITLDARERDDESVRTESYAKLLKFLDTTNNYNVGRIYGILSSHGRSIFTSFLAFPVGLIFL
jgi:Vam6/Vps39-like protein vacuolar protein sorting-associated protein 39